MQERSPPSHNGPLVEDAVKFVLDLFPSGSHASAPKARRKAEMDTTTGQRPSEMTRKLIHDYLDRHAIAVLASASAAGAPQAALMGIAVVDDLSLVFDTVTTTRKYANLKS